MLEYIDIPCYYLYKISVICDENLNDDLNKDKLIEIIKNIDNYLNKIKEYSNKI